MGVLWSELRPKAFALEFRRRNIVLPDTATNQEIFQNIWCLHSILYSDLLPAYRIPEDLRAGFLKRRVAEIKRERRESLLDLRKANKGPLNRSSSEYLLENWFRYLFGLPSKFTFGTLYSDSQAFDYPNIKKLMGFILQESDYVSMRSKDTTGIEITRRANNSMIFAMTNRRNRLVLYLQAPEDLTRLFKRYLVPWKKKSWSASYNEPGLLLRRPKCLETSAKNVLLTSQFRASLTMPYVMENYILVLTLLSSKILHECCMCLGETLLIEYQRFCKVDVYRDAANEIARVLEETRGVPYGDIVEQILVFAFLASIKEIVDDDFGRPLRQDIHHRLILKYRYAMDILMTKLHREIIVTVLPKEIHQEIIEAIVLTFEQDVNSVISIVLNNAGVFQMISTLGFGLSEPMTSCVLINCMAKVSDEFKKDINDSLRTLTLCNYLKLPPKEHHRQSRWIESALKEAGELRAARKQSWKTYEKTKDKSGQRERAGVRKRDRIRHIREALRSKPLASATVEKAKQKIGSNIYHVNNEVVVIFSPRADGTLEPRETRVNRRPKYSKLIKLQEQEVNNPKVEEIREEPMGSAGAVQFFVPGEERQRAQKAPAKAKKQSFEDMWFDDAFVDCAGVSYVYEEDVLNISGLGNVGQPWSPATESEDNDNIANEIKDASRGYSLQASAFADNLSTGARAKHPEVAFNLNPPILGNPIVHPNPDVGIIGQLVPLTIDVSDQPRAQRAPEQGRSNIEDLDLSPYYRATSGLAGSRNRGGFTDEPSEADARIAYPEFPGNPTQHSRSDVGIIGQRMPLAADSSVHAGATGGSVLGKRTQKGGNAEMSEISLYGRSAESNVVVHCAQSPTDVVLDHPEAQGAIPRRSSERSSRSVESLNVRPNDERRVNVTRTRLNTHPVQKVLPQRRESSSGDSPGSDTLRSYDYVVDDDVMTFVVPEYKSTGNKGAKSKHSDQSSRMPKESKNVTSAADDTHETEARKADGTECIDDVVHRIHEAKNKVDMEKTDEMPTVVSSVIGKGYGGDITQELRSENDQSEGSYMNNPNRYTDNISNDRKSNVTNTSGASISANNPNPQQSCVGDQKDTIGLYCGAELHLDMNYINWAIVKPENIREVIHAYLYPGRAIGEHMYQDEPGQYQDMEDDVFTRLQLLYQQNPNFEVGGVLHQNYEASAMPHQNYEASAMPHQNYEASAMPHQNYEASAMPHHDFGASAMPDHDFGASAMPDHDFGASAMPDHDFGASAMPDHNFGASAMPDHDFGASAMPDHNFGASAMPDHDFGASAMLDHNFGASAMSDHDFGASAMPDHNFGASAMPDHNFGASAMPDHNFGASAIPDRNYGAGAMPSQNYAIPDQNYRASAMPDQNFGASAMLDQNFGASAMLDQSHRAGTLSSHDYGASAFPDRNYGAGAMPSQNYAIPDQNYRASAIPDQNYRASAFPDQNYRASTISDQNYRASAIPDQNYRASTISDQNYRASAIPDQNYRASAIPDQNYRASSIPDQNYRASTISDQNYGTSASPDKNYGASAMSSQNYGAGSTASASPDQNYGASAMSSQNYGASSIPGQSCGTSSSPDQSCGTSSSPDQSCGTSSSPDQSCGTSSSPGHQSCGASSRASASPDQNYGASAMSSQNHGASTIPDQNYELRAVTDQSYGTGASQEQIREPRVGQNYGKRDEPSEPSEKFILTRQSRNVPRTIRRSSQNYNFATENEGNVSNVLSPTAPPFIPSSHRNPPNNEEFARAHPEDQSHGSNSPANQAPMAHSAHPNQPSMGQQQQTPRGEPQPRYHNRMSTQQSNRRQDTTRPRHPRPGSRFPPGNYRRSSQ